MNRYQLVFLSIPYLCLIFFSWFEISPDPISYRTFFTIKLKFFIGTYSNCIFFRIFCYHEKSWATSDFYTFSLTDRVGECSFMFSDDFALSVEYISWIFRESTFEKFFHTDFSDKTESLAIFPFCIRESDFFCYDANFRFRKMSDREECFRKLK